MTTHSKDHGVGSLQETDSDIISHATDIFSMPVLEPSMIVGRTTTVKPTNAENEGPFEFRIVPQGPLYVHLAAMRALLVLRLVNEDGTDITAADKVAPVNLIGSSLFKSIDIDIAGVPVPDLSNMYSNYKAYFETILSYSKTAAESHVLCSRFHMDKEALFDTHDDSNKGWDDRSKYAAESKKFQVMIPIHSDFIQCDKLLPPGVHWTIRFTRASDDFTYTVPTANNKKYKIVIDDFRLYVRHIELNRDIVSKHLTKFDSQPAIYHINKTVMKTFSYAQGFNTITVPSILSDILPKTLIFGLVKADALRGNSKLNPYNFQHFGLSSANIRINSESVPAEIYTPNFTDKLYIREYREFFDNIGISHNDMGNVITPVMYANGCTLFAFDLTPDKCNGRHYHPRQSGTIDLELAFKANLTSTINVVVFAIYDAIVLLDKFNKVTTDIAP